MKVILVATTVALISLTLTLATLAAPTQWKTDNMKNQLLKSIINQALLQQEDSPSTKDKDKEMVASFCKILIQILIYLNISEEFSGPGDGAEDDYCQDLELSPEPIYIPEEKSTLLANIYQLYFNFLKNSGIDKTWGKIIKMISG